jgi:hypothetical protein
MLYALLFLPALVALAVVFRPRPARVVAEAAPPAVSISGDADPLAALDAVLADLERATVRIDGADELDEHAVAALEDLADRVERAAARLERVG